MGFQIRQTRPKTLREAMEAAQNYENSAQSLRKSVRQAEGTGKKHRRGRRKYSSPSETSSSSESGTASTSSSSESEAAVNTKTRNRQSGSGKNRKGKELAKVKVEEDDSWKMMKNIQDTLATIQVNLAENRKPRRTVPTSWANVWCARCGEAGHFPPECNRPPQKWIQYVQPRRRSTTRIRRREKRERISIRFTTFNPRMEEDKPPPPSEGQPQEPG